MPKDLRQYLRLLEEQAPHELLEIKRRVDATAELSAVLWQMERDGLYPATIFRDVPNPRGEPSGIPVVTNLFASREKVAMAMGLPPAPARMEASLAYVHGRDNPIQPVVVDRAEAPVKQNVRVGEEANLFDLPVVTHHEMDAGPYLTMPVVGRDPDNGRYNVSFQRMWVKGPRDAGISISPRHLWNFVVRYEARGEATPIAVVLGHHPTFCLGAMASLEMSEYDVIGGLMEEPLRLVASETWGSDFLVPADAEIVVEAEIVPKAREIEAPFGEFTGYYGCQKLNPVVRVRAITFRNQPLYQTIFIGHRDSDILIGLPIEGDVYNAIRPIVPTVKAVHVPPSGKTFNCYISIQKRYEGAGKLAGVAALPVHDFIKHAIVVDDDIDVYNEEEVLFALATRVQGDRDIDFVRGIRGNVLDPSSDHGITWTNMIIDATRPVDRAFEPRLEMPEAYRQGLNLADYIEPETLALVRGRNGNGAEHLLHRVS